MYYFNNRNISLNYSDILPKSPLVTSSGIFRSYSCIGCDNLIRLSCFSVTEGALNEEVLIRRAQAGEEVPFRRLVDKHANIIWTVINKMTSDQALASDMFQETIIRFWKGLPSFAGNSKLSTWLYKITYRVCLDNLNMMNKGGRMTSLDEQLENTGLEPMDESRSGAKIEDRIAAKDALTRGMEKLNPEWRTMLILFYWRGLSIDEVAEITDRPVNTVKVYLHRARGEMRKILNQGGFSQEKV